MIMGRWKKLEALKDTQFENSRWHQNINNTKIIDMLEQ